jgi:hypothetical protein
MYVIIATAVMIAVLVPTALQATGNAPSGGNQIVETADLNVDPRAAHLPAQLRRSIIHVSSCEGFFHTAS